MTRNAYSQTGYLLVNYLRNNKVVTLLLVLLPLLFSYGVSASNIAVLQTSEQLSAYIAENQGNLMLGHIAANTIEAASVWRVRISAAIIISILTIVLTISNTRSDEDLGRLEVLRAGAVGSKAPLTAMFVKIFGANLLGGVMMAVGFIVAGFPVAGSFASGFSTALCACFFTALSAAAAQIADNARLARGLSFGAVAVFMVIQVIANAAQSEFLLLCTPFGWCAYARPYANENPWLFVFAILIITLLAVIAYTLSERRDLNFGYKSNA